MKDNYWELMMKINQYFFIIINKNKIQILKIMINK